MKHVQDKNVCQSILIFLKQRVRQTRLPLFYHRGVYRLTKHDILEDYQKERPGNHNAYSLTLSITVWKIPPMTASAVLFYSACTTCTSSTQWPMLYKKQCKNSWNNACREHPAGKGLQCILVASIKWIK